MGWRWPTICKAVMRCRGRRSPRAKARCQAAVSVLTVAAVNCMLTAMRCLLWWGLDSAPGYGISVLLSSRPPILFLQYYRNEGPIMLTDSVRETTLRVPSFDGMPL